PALASAWNWLAPTLTELEHGGVTRDHIAALAVFTTQDAVSEFYRSVDEVQALPAPTVKDLQLRPDSGPFLLYQWHFGPVPIYQQGQTPYSTAGSGDFAFDDAGSPVAQGSEDLVFVLAVPSGPVPASGFPVAIYAHGSFGDAFSYVNDGS